MDDTIFALSSGAPPAAIGVIRISGPSAGPALERLAGRLPQPRRASYRRLRDDVGETLDRVLVLWFPGPATATGEDLAELHCHGGRGVIAAVEAALAKLPLLRRATAGEFTRRAFRNGRIDLAEAEGLADLLSAETDLQRRSAEALAGGALSRQVGSWREEVLRLSALVEAGLDFSDEDDVGEPSPALASGIAALASELVHWLERPRAEMLREGFRVVLAGPPNAGKSTLFNCLVDSEAALTSPSAGTTRDVLTRSVAIEGVAFQFFDTAGLHEGASDPVEIMGIDRARSAAERADLVLWLGEDGAGPPGAWEIESRIDRPDHSPKRQPRHRVSATTGEGIDDLKRSLVGHALQAMPRPGEVALNARQHSLLREAEMALALACAETDPLLVAEGLRLARQSFDRLTGKAGTEEMLDALFGRFCIGK
jgi:tRNA modification GTPase